MNSLKLYLVNTKLFKRISICFCSLLMVFASVFCPYSEVKALVGVDDAFYAYAFVTALGVLGIGLASSDASRDAVVDVGTKAYNSFKKYVPMIGEAAVTNVTNFFNFCKDTGKIALDKLDGIKGDIAKWWNATSTASYLTSDIISQSGLSDYGISDINIKSSMDPTVFKSYIPSRYHQFCNYQNLYGYYIYFKDIDLFIYGSQLANTFCNIGPYLFINPYSNELVCRVTYMNSYKFNYNFQFLTTVDGVVTNYNYDDHALLLNEISTQLMNFSTLNIISNSNYLAIKNFKTNYMAYCSDGTWTLTNQGTLELDPPKKVTDSFKLDDRVLGLDNVLKLTDTIVGAVGSLTLDKTKDVTTTLGTLDIPDTAIDYPYTGTWDNTLGKIGAIAWNPDIDVPIADTKIIAPTVTPDGKPNADKKVDDFDGEGGQLTFDWKNVFPFCIPFDMIKFIQCLCADPVAPVVDIPVNIPNIYKGNININLKQYDDVAKLCRTLFDLLFILGLAYATRYLIKG